jgi:Domain of unknown function (DUF4112)
MNSVPHAAAQPQILPPRGRILQRLFTRKGRNAFDNENLDLIAHVLDDWFRIPGTRIRFGLDGIVGLIPGLGDILGGLASCILIFAAWYRGLPYVTLVRMVVNVAVEVIIGTIPFLGDAFDIAWKANRRNYALMTRHIESPRKHTWRDWAFLLLLAGLVVAIFAVPLVMIGWFLARTIPHS